MPRRPFAVVLAGVLALIGLAACRDQPTVAAYVGSVQFTNADVERIVNEFPQDKRAALAGGIRQVVVRDFIISEVATRIGNERGLPPRSADPADYQSDAANLKVDMGSAYIKLIERTDAAMATITPASQPQAPTEADQREVYTQLVSSGVLRQGVTFEQIKPELDTPDMRAALGLRKVIADGVAKYGVVVNPRYRPLGIPFSFTLNNGQVQSKLVIPLDPDTHPAVIDTTVSP
jgi:hypothetical protein